MKNITTAEAISFLKSIPGEKSIAVTKVGGQLGADGVVYGGTEYKVRRKVYYIAGLAANLPSDRKLIQQKTDRDVAITNFDGGNKLNAGKNLLVIGVRMLFDVTTDVTPDTATWLSAAPANFKNGELKISQQGDSDLFDNPILPFSKYNASIATEDEFQSVVPFLIRPNVAFDITVNLAGETAANQAYRLELDCVELIEADKA